MDTQSVKNDTGGRADPGAPTTKKRPVPLKLSE